MRKKRHERITILLLIFCLLFVSTLVFSTQADEDDTSIIRTVPADILDLSAPAKQSKGNPKLGSSLIQLLNAHQHKGMAEAQAFALSHQMVTKKDRVQVTIITADNKIDQVRKTVETHGGEYELHYRNRLQAMVPFNVLEVLANRSDVLLIHEPRRLGPDKVMRIIPMAGTETTEGLTASNADTWHTAGYNGNGARVAIIDIGFTGYKGLLGTDLPDAVATYDWTGTGMAGSIHGTACAEVVFDMAPGIKMDLHKVSTPVELGNAVNQAITDGVDIISMSAGFHLDGPGDGTGFLAGIVKNARSSGIFFAISAGNYAESSWSGTFTDSNRDDLHEWSPDGLIVNYFGPGDGNGNVIPAGTPIIAYLHWNDWNVVDQDYDLLLYGFDGSAWQLVAFSADSQNGEAGQAPEESIGIITPFEGLYGVIVVKYSATRDVCFRMHTVTWPQYGLNERVPERSLIFPADSPDAITVGAVDVISYDIEPYSSRGPAFGPGGDCDAGTVKPDLVAYDNVSTMSYGAQGFPGTSAAAPHVAGAAALLKEAYPLYTVDDLQDHLEAQAVDIGEAGKDNLYGWGRLYMGPTNHTVTFQIGTGGSITGDLAQVVPDGGDCTPVTAVANQGYKFIGWSGDYTGTENPLTITNVTSDMTITAEFKKTYMITFIAGPNGSISGECEQVVEQGCNCSTVTAVADSGYKFTKWTGDYTSTNNPLTITNILADMTVTANFEKDGGNVSSGGGGGGGGCFIDCISDRM